MLKYRIPQIVTLTPFLETGKVEALHDIKKVVSI